MVSVTTTHLYLHHAKAAGDSILMSKCLVVFQRDYEGRWWARHCAWAIAHAPAFQRSKLTDLQSNGVFPLKLLSTVLPTDSPMIPMCILIFPDPKRLGQGEQSDFPTQVKILTQKNP